MTIVITKCASKMSVNMSVREALNSTHSAMSQ